jgi:hypothetical protein
MGTALVTAGVVANYKPIPWKWSTDGEVPFLRGDPGQMIITVDRCIGSRLHDIQFDHHEGETPAGCCTGCNRPLAHESSN